jgi:hypothetical protein
MGPSLGKAVPFLRVVLFGEQAPDAETVLRVILLGEQAPDAETVLRVILFGEQAPDAETVHGLLLLCVKIDCPICWGLGDFRRLGIGERTGGW